MRIFFPTLLALTLSLPASALAQSQADDERPQRLQTEALRQLEVQEAQPTLPRRVLEVLVEDDEEEATPERGREPARSYGLTCANIRRVSVLEVVIRVTCYDQDRFGNLTYSLEVAGYQDVSPRDQARRWYASEFLQAVYHVQQTPGAALSLRVGEQRAYEPYIQTFAVEYEE